MTLVEFCGGEARERLTLTQRKRIREYHNQVKEEAFFRVVIPILLERYRYAIPALYESAKPFTLLRKVNATAERAWQAKRTREDER